MKKIIITTRLSGDLLIVKETNAFFMLLSEKDIQKISLLSESHSLEATINDELFSNIFAIDWESCFEFIRSHDHLDLALDDIRNQQLCNLNPMYIEAIFSYVEFIFRKGSPVCFIKTTPKEYFALENFFLFYLNSVVGLEKNNICLLSINRINNDTQFFLSRFFSQRGLFQEKSKRLFLEKRESFASMIKKSPFRDILIFSTVALSVICVFAGYSYTQDAKIEALAENIASFSRDSETGICNLEIVPKDTSTSSETISLVNYQRAHDYDYLAYESRVNINSKIQAGFFGFSLNGTDYNDISLIGNRDFTVKTSDTTGYYLSEIDILTKGDVNKTISPGNDYWCYISDTLAEDIQNDLHLSSVDDVIGQSIFVRFFNDGNPIIEKWSINNIIISDYGLAPRYNDQYSQYLFSFFPFFSQGFDGLSLSIDFDRGAYRNKEALKTVFSSFSTTTYDFLFGSYETFNDPQLLHFFLLAFPNYSPSVFQWLFLTFGTLFSFLFVLFQFGTMVSTNEKGLRKNGLFSKHRVLIEVAFASLFGFLIPFFISHLDGKTFSSLFSSNASGFSMLICIIFIISSSGSLKFPKGRGFVKHA